MTGRRLTTLGLIACLLLLAGCGSRSSRSHATGPVTVLMASGPNSLDPAVGSTPQAMEADWLVYTPLLTYDHSTGLNGTIVIPGLASALPTISDGGRTYTLTLQPGLLYSNGQPVMASDFAWAVERAIRLGWAAAPRWLTHRIVGAAAFAAGRSRGIAGIATNDATGQITIQLVAPDGEFENVLALPALAPVPGGTPFRDLAAAPPPGVGPYVFGAVAPGRSFTLVLNPHWRRGMLPGVPSGGAEIAARVTGSARYDARSVLNNAADVLDPWDGIPPYLLPQILNRASARFSKQALNSTYLIFLNVTRRPFSDQLARVAVQTALDDNVMKSLGAGTLQEGCYLLPPSLYGHPHDQCPRGNIEAGGDLAAGRALVARSGMSGAPVTVWAPAGAPISSWMAYYTQLLNQIGFHARLRLVSSHAYYQRIGDPRVHPQTGFGEISGVLPSPVQFYGRLTGVPPGRVQNGNWSQLDDPYVNQQVRLLSAFPSDSLDDVAGYWHSLERYVASRAYLAVFGYRTAPQFASDRLVYSRIVFSPVVGLDWSSLRLR